MMRNDACAPILATVNGGGLSSLTFVEIAMFIFIAVFLTLLIWVIFAKRGAFSRVKRIPLEEDKVVTPRGHAKTQAGEGRRRDSDNQREKRD